MVPGPNVLGEALPRSPEADARIAAITARAGYMMGRNVERAWSPERAAAWEGFLELGRQLRRAAEGLLEPFGLSVSMLGVMGRLGRAERRTLRQTELAEAMGLSVSRISRLIDALERRDLVERRPCPADARATNVTLTRAGLTLARKAQDAVFGFVEEQFFAPLDDPTVVTLAEAFTTLLARRQDEAGSCV